MQLGAGAALILAAMGMTASSPVATQQRLRFVTVARQLGPVAYRDPLGVPSPDGRWLATHIGLHLRLEPIEGGPVSELGEGRYRRLYLAWRPDSQALVAREADRDRTWFDWFEYDVSSGARHRLWEGRESFVAPDGGRAERSDLLELTFAADGRGAGLVRRDGGLQLWIFDGAGEVVDVRGQPGPWSAVTWAPDGSIACIDGGGERPYASFDCGRAPGRTDLGEVRGPIAFAGDDLIAARPNDRGTVDLWRFDVASGDGERITDFTRDTYAPYALADGRVLFKLQDFAATIARVSADGGTPVPVTTFQSETPSWDWAGERIAFTYGSWRRVVDDVNYPDIAQHVGVVRVADGVADEPLEVVRHSYSEDQGMHWSPNGRWIVLHSHADGTDDVWLQPADGSRPAVPITDGGNETGWPRFSPDGRWIIYPTDYRGPDGDRLGLLQIVGFDQDSGEVTERQREVELDGFDGQVSFAEFGPDSRTIFFEAIHEVGKRAVWKVDRDGGRPELVHRFDSEQWFTGIGVSPDGSWVAYIAPAADGYLQLFRVPAVGGEPVQLTFDTSDKTHPTWSPAGDQIAFTVFRYLATFWLWEPPTETLKR
ncbi:MAG: hypothetical protein PVJ49_15780 [Acidobacteriota bacterium]